MPKFQALVSSWDCAKPYSDTVGLGFVEAITTSLPAANMFPQNAPHFFDGFGLTLRRVARAHDLFRLDSFNMRAFIRHYSVCFTGNRPIAPGSTPSRAPILRGGVQLDKAASLSSRHPILAVYRQTEIQLSQNPRSPNLQASKPVLHLFAGDGNP